MAFSTLSTLTRTAAALAVSLAATLAAGAAEKATIRLKWVPQAQFAGIYRI